MTSYRNYNRRVTGNYGRYYSPYSFSYWWLYPSGTRFYHYGCTDDKPETNKEDKEESEPEVDTLVIKDVNFCIEENIKAHHTDEYEITEKRTTGEEPQLIVRRGQNFEIQVTVDRKYQKEKDEFSVHLQLGKSPKPSKGTDQRLQLRSSALKNKWCAWLKPGGQEGNVMTINLQSPPTALVGKWKLSFDTKVKKDHDKDNSTKLNRYTHKEGIYILFNPWCKDDIVFFNDECWRDETILNEVGKIFTGNYKQIGAKAWNFGQFEDIVLDCALDLLDKAELPLPSRGDPAQVVRKISAIVNNCDDEGVLVGNWSGKYEGGRAPTSWTGSVAILQQYLDNGESPVCFGQCWVFSALCTTVCRALGIPARSVTNFASAHDCDGSVTIDKYWTAEGDPIDEMNDDSCWNFHVWNEAWMARPDLPTGFGGWQAFDATPQETSEGAYQAGPCSVAAIKQGFIGFPKDGAFIFAEVNADKVHWVLQKDSTWKTSLDKIAVGKKISTKMPRMPMPAGTRRNRWAMFERHPDRCDVTNNYKFKEGGEQERAAVYRANQGATGKIAADIYTEHDDCKFDLEIKDDILVGSNFDITMKIQNQSRETRTVCLKLSVSPCFYTGVRKSPVKVKDYKLEIPAIKTKEAVLRLTHEDYMHYVVDQVAFKVLAGGLVEETGQIFNMEDDFRLRRPDVIVEAPFECKKDEELEVNLKVINPLPVHLTNCQWQIEGPGIQKSKTEDERDVEPYETITTKITLRPRRKGKRQIQVSFNSTELADVTGSHDVEVHRE